MEREPLAQRVRHWFAASRQPVTVGHGVTGAPRGSRPLAPRPSREGVGSPAEKRAFLSRVEEAARLVEHGRRASAIVLSRETSDRRFNGAQIIVVELEILDSQQDSPRTLVYEHLFGPATARSWKPGHEIPIWIDPRDPERIYAGR